MSRFKPSLSTPPSIFSQRSNWPRAPQVSPAYSAPAQEIVRSGIPAETGGLRSSPMETVGFFVLCLYLVSGHANDWSIRLFGNAVYLSRIAIIAAPLLWILSRSRFRGLRHGMGPLWAIFLACLLVDLPFSYWRTGSLTLLVNYVPRSYILFFLVTAFVTSIRRCRVFLLVQISCAVVVLVSCYMYGTSGVDGRLRIPDSLFFSNSNELGLQLLVGIPMFTFLFYQPGILRKAFAIFCIEASFLYMMRTGSRGCFVGAILYCLLVILFSRRKILAISLMLGVAVIGVALTPSMASRRLALLWDPTAQSGAELSAVESQFARKELLYRSIIETFRHPLFGVGPGQFAVAVAGEAEKKGERAAWLGTHNSYTQISSECGIPAFVCYLMVIVLSFRVNMRLFKRARHDPGLKETAGMSFTILSGVWVYAVCTAFFHMAYSGLLPILSGLTVALYLSSDLSLREEWNSTSARSVAVTA